MSFHFTAGFSKNFFLPIRTDCVIHEWSKRHVKHCYQQNIKLTWILALLTCIYSLIISWYSIGTALLYSTFLQQQAHLHLIWSICLRVQMLLPVTQELEWLSWLVYSRSNHILIAMSVYSLLSLMLFLIFNPHHISKRNAICVTFARWAMKDLIDMHHLNL